MKAVILRWLRVPARPTPPPGADHSYVAFNPSRKVLYLRWIRWGFSQISAFLGIVFSLAFLGSFDLPQNFERFGNWRQEVSREMELEEPMDFEILGVNIAGDFDLIDLLRSIEGLAIGLFLLQLVVSAFLLKLRWETHWYMVSDRTLGIRKGLLSLSEQTMTIANVQNMKINQGPLQRLLGIADLEVQTAGGSSGASSGKGQSGSGLHVGLFEGLDNAEELRRTIRVNLARHRTSGLGDPGEAEEDHLEPDDHGGRSAGDSGLTRVGASSGATDLLIAARELGHHSQRARRAAERLLDAAPGSRA